MLEFQLAGEFGSATPEQSWRTDGDRQVGVMITELGRKALTQLNQAREPAALQGSSPVNLLNAPEPIARNCDAPRPMTKQAKVLDLLKREEGASIAELVDATGWLPHTTRAALTGIRKRGTVVIKATVDGVTRYQVGSQ
jgi:DNA-binding MarR family transcriptional regulator